MNLAPIKSRLARVLEPEVMDTSQDAHDYDAMDHAEVNRRFVDDFLAAQSRAGLPADTLVLDLGTGTAQIPIELCRRSPQARVVAIDLSENMLQLARANVARHGLESRIACQLVDAKRLPFGNRGFAAVMSNSIVHHIPSPGDALAEACRALADDGLIFVRDLSRPYDDHSVRELVDLYAGGCNAHQRQLFDDSLRAALSVEETRTLVERLGFDPASVEPTSDRHWTWSARGPRAA